MIIIMRGYPGSGKSTQARSLVREAEGLMARVSRDDLRATLFDRNGVLPHEVETLVTKLQREQVVRLVKSGYDVIVDDTNLRARYARAWADLAVELGVDFAVFDVTTDVEECCRRDHARMREGGRYVGDDVIRKIAAKFPIGRWPNIAPTERAATRTWPVYTPDILLPPAYIIDIDGTVAAKRIGEGERGWHEYHRVDEDEPKHRVIEVVTALAGHLDGWAGQIVFVSGRKEHCREKTRGWLASQVGLWTSECPLFMRADDDNRADDIVKNEIFEREIAPHYNVLATLDDRQRVVDMWRAKGLTCLQVDAWAEAGA